MGISLNYSPDCCAIQEICGLNTYHDPEVALKTLCRTNWNRYTKSLNDFGSFVLFSTVVEVTSEDNAMKSNRWDPEIGPKFAEYLVANRLGKVSYCGTRPNRLNHPDHRVAVWVWAPSRRGLATWWAIHRKRVKEAE